MTLPVGRFCFCMLIGVNIKHVYIMVPDVIHLVKICWMLCLREGLCFCAGGGFHASSVTCSFMLVTNVPDKRKMKYYPRTRKDGL